MDLHPDFRDLLAEFAHAGARYAVLGGYAVGYHAKPRATKDLDVLVSARDDNLERIAMALSSFGAPGNVIDAARNMAADEVVYLGTPPVRIDLMRSADGVDTEQVIGRAVIVSLGSLVIPMIALDDLIANKRAAGRPQDLADVALLERIRGPR